jgi:geranylgeranyl transferase type-2 subunit beta
MRINNLTLALIVATISTTSLGADEPKPASPEEVLKGLQQFYAKTARPDGSFQPGVDPDYRGMSDAAYSDLAAITYAVTIHKTFGWKLPHEDKTISLLLSRQKPTGEFVNLSGTVRPESAEGKTYNTTQALVALHALGVKPKYDPLPVFEEILKADYKELPPYTTSFFPLAYLCAGKPIPAKADRGIRALMIQDRTGYMNDHIAATFHASHYYHLVGEPTPKTAPMLSRILSDQKKDGSWFLNMPSRDRHATFDAVFTLVHEGNGNIQLRAAINSAARWALSCRNDDGGFGHFPGSTSDADANYFQIGTLVMANFLKPVDPLPADPHLLSWGHLMPVREDKPSREVFSAQLGGWVGAVAFTPDSKTVLIGTSDGTVRMWDVASGRGQSKAWASDSVGGLSVSPTEPVFAAGDQSHSVKLWNLSTGDKRGELKGHRGAVLAVAFDPSGKTLATAGVDSTIILWDVQSRSRSKSLTGHKSWVNSLAYSADGKLLFSGSSDGTVRVWNPAEDKPVRAIDATNSEVRSIAVSKDGKWLAAGIRYGPIKVWNLETGKEHLSFKGHESDVWVVGFTPDSETLISGNGDWNRPGHVKLWNVHDGKHINSFQHTGEVLSLAVSPDGRYLAAGGGDKAIRVWELKTPVGKK